MFLWNKSHGGGGCGAGSPDDRFGILCAPSLEDRFHGRCIWRPPQYKANLLSASQVLTLRCADTIWLIRLVWNRYESQGRIKISSQNPPRGFHRRASPLGFATPRRRIPRCPNVRNTRETRKPDRTFQLSHCECPRMGFPCPCPRAFFGFLFFPPWTRTISLQGIHALGAGGKRQEWSRMRWNLIRRLSPNLAST